MAKQKAKGNPAVKKAMTKSELLNAISDQTDLKRREVADVLEELRGEDLPLAVISNWQRGLRHFCQDLGLSHFFEHILGSADLGMDKPDELIFHEASRLLGVAPERILHVGDTPVDDYQGGEAAGMQVVLIDRQGAVDPPAARVIRSLAELTGLVRGSRGHG